MLLLIDGRRSEAEVRALAERAGAPGSCFGELLDMGLIARAEPASRPAPLLSPAQPMPLASSPAPLAAEPEPQAVDPAPETLPFQHIDLPFEEESLLPAARTLQPESSLNGELGPPVAWYPDDTDPGAVDAPLEEARDLLLKAVRSEAPVAGSLTIMRLRRAGYRADLLALLPEVEQRIRRPQRELATNVLLQRVRSLLGAATVEPR